MKRLYLWVGMLAASTTLTFSACDSLDQAPEDYFAGGNFWTDASQVEGAAVGLHSYFRGAYGANFEMGELRGGTLGDGNNGSGTSVDNVSLNHQSVIKQQVRQSQAMFSNWNGMYANIVRCNELLDRVDGLNFLTDTQKARYKAQAYGLRAYYYFFLYRTWGGVPKVLDLAITQGQVSAERLYRERATPEEIMTLLKSDIDASEAEFKKADEQFRNVYTWNVYATLMLKANIYAWAARVSTPTHREDGAGSHTATGAADLRTAREALQTVISSGKFQLLSSFADVFSPDNKRNAEVIMAVPYNTTDKIYTPYAAQTVPANDKITTLFDASGKAVVLDDARYGYRALSGGISRYQYKESFFRTFDAVDTRRDATFCNLFRTANGTKTGTDFGIILRKFAGHYETAESTHYFDTDGIVYRYAETLLLMAEVENALGNDPMPYLNAVRQRAYGAAHTDLTRGSAADNERAILAERDKEFVFEGKRWFDLIRMKDAAGESLVFSAAVNYPFIPDASEGAVLDKGTESHKILWPIDTNTLTNDRKLQQNPGYSATE